jgi:hypothetical protein
MEEERPMFRKRRWLVIFGLILAQVGVIICYQGFLRGSSEPPVAPGGCALEKPQPVAPQRIESVPLRRRLLWPPLP